MFPAFSLIQGPLSPVYRWYLSGLIQLPMNIGMCLHPSDPAIRGGDQRVSQTQTEHDISLTAASSTWTHTCRVMDVQDKNINFQKKQTKKKISAIKTE